MSLAWLRRLGGGTVGPPDGQGLDLEELDPEVARSRVDTSPRPTAQTAPRSAKRHTVEAEVGAKLLGAHLANRHQISYPLTLDFTSLTPEEGDLLIDVALAALAAEGIDDETRDRRAVGTLRRVGASAGQLDRLRSRSGTEKPLGEIVAAARRHDKAAYAYAVSLLALSPRSAVAQMYLVYLAARLGLTQTVVGSLNRRFRG